jgi:hypothetical protein
MTRVWLAAYPRSGVTFLRLVLEAMYGVKTYTVYPPANDIAAVGNLFPLARSASRDIPPGDGYAFIKTHEIKHAAAKGLAIHLVRDGRDALVSQAHFSMAGNHAAAGMCFDEVLRHLILGTLPRSSQSSDPPWNWSEHTKTWAGRANRTLLRFTDFIREPALAVWRAVVHFIPDISPKPMCDGIPGFDDLHARSPHFFRSGKVGQWQEEMPDELHDLFWEHHGEAMDLVGYKREAVCLSG